MKEVIEVSLECTCKNEEGYTKYQCVIEPWEIAELAFEKIKKERKEIINYYNSDMMIKRRFG